MHIENSLEQRSVQNMRRKLGSGASWFHIRDLILRDLWSRADVQSDRNLTLKLSVWDTCIFCLKSPFLFHFLSVK